jgi:hypothetical protein
MNEPTTDPGIMEALKQSTIGAALSGFNFVSPAAQSHAARLFADEIEVKRDVVGQVLVTDRRSGRLASEMINEAMASPAWSHYLQPAAQRSPAAPETPFPVAPGVVLSRQNVIAEWVRAAAATPPPPNERRGLSLLRRRP